MKTVYALRFNRDTTEGRGPMEIKGLFLQGGDAKTVGVKSNNYDMGGGALWDIQPMFVFDSVSDYNDYKTGEVKTRALAKLSQEERQVLGFE